MMKILILQTASLSVMRVLKLEGIEQRTWGVRGWESCDEWGKNSPTLFRIRRTRIAASGALPKPSVIRVIVVGHC